MADKNNFKKLAGEWFLKSEEDELSARDILKDKEGAPSTVCFLSQQMAEKLLKRYLVYKETEFPKIHDLDKLIELCKEKNISFNNFKEGAQELSDFYISTRYPGDYPQFTWQDAKRAFIFASQIKSFVLDNIK